MSVIKSKEDALKYRYGRWAGNERGSAYDPERCAWPVWVGSRGMIESQCSKKNGRGSEGIFCGQHAKLAPVWVERRS